MKVIFLDKLIRWWTGSLYSHCEIYDSKLGFCHSSSYRDGGVRYKLIKVERNPNWYLKRIDIGNDDEILNNLCNKNIGKYDVMNLFFTHFFKCNTHHKDKYTCAEYCAEIIGLENAHKYSPATLKTELSTLNMDESMEKCDYD